MNIIKDSEQAPDNKTLSLAGQLAQVFIGDLKRNSATKDMFRHWKTIIDGLTDYIRNLPVENTFLKNRVIERVNHFDMAARCAFKLSNPKTTPEAGKKTVPLFQKHFNQIIKDENNQDFIKDINNLLDHVGLDETDSREFQILRAMNQIGNKVEGLANGKDVADKYHDLSEEADNLDSELNLFHQGMDVTAQMMRNFDPTLNTENIHEKSEKITNEHAQAAEKLRLFNNRKDVIDIHEKTQPMEKEILEMQKRYTEMVLLNRSRPGPSHAVANYAKYLQEEKRRQELFGQVDKETAFAMENDLKNKLTALISQKNAIEAPIANEQNKLNSDYRKATNDLNIMNNIQFSIANNAQAYLRLSKQQAQFKQKVDAIRNNQGYENVVKNLTGVKYHLDKVTIDKSHKNGPEFTLMDKQLINTISTLSDKNKSAAEKIKELSKLKDFSARYLSAKEKQFFSYGSDLRKSRIADVKNILELATNELARQKTINSQKTVNKVKSVADRPQLNKQKFTDILKQKQAHAVNKQHIEKQFDKKIEKFKAMF